MIKIIKYGTKIKQLECHKCGCIFQYEIEDVITKSVLGDPYTPATKRLIHCPQCNIELELEENDNED